MSGGARSSAMLVAAVLGLIGVSEAAQPGFYVAGAASRVEQDIDSNNDELVLLAGGFAPVPIFRPAPPLTVPDPSFAVIISPFPGAVAGAVAVASVPDTTRIDSGQLGWDGVLGYRVNRYFAAEFAYVDFGTTDYFEHYTFPRSSPTLPPIEFTRDLSINVRGPAVSLLGSYPVHPSWDVFVRGGVLFAGEEVEQGMLDTSATFNDEVWMAGVGVDWWFSQRWAARLEYQRTGKIEQNIAVGASELEQFSLRVLFQL